MPNEQRKIQDDFIVVGGKRRWFSIPGNDQRIDDLQQRIKQERSLVSPDRPSETAWITVIVELKGCNDSHASHVENPLLPNMVIDNWLQVQAMCSWHQRR